MKANGVVTRSALAAVLSLSAAASAAASLGCATARPQHVAGGTPRPDPRGVPIGGTSLAFYPNPSSNFIGAESLGVPGSGAFAGSGPGRMEAARDAATARTPPAVVPEVPPPAVVVPTEAPLAAPGPASPPPAP